MVQFYVSSPIQKVSEKKWATAQSFIRKEITTYRIGTLVGYSGGSPRSENAVKRWGQQIKPICFSVYFDASP